MHLVRVHALIALLPGKCRHACVCACVRMSKYLRCLHFSCCLRFFLANSEHVATLFYSLILIRTSSCSVYATPASAAPPRPFLRYAAAGNARAFVTFRRGSDVHVGDNAVGGLASFWRRGERYTVTAAAASLSSSLPPPLLLAADVTSVVAGADRSPIVFQHAE